MKTKEDMKAILEFDLPTDKEDFELAQKASSYKIAWSDLWNWIRTETKYKDRTELTFEELRAELIELQNEYEIE